MAYKSFKHTRSSAPWVLLTVLLVVFLSPLCRPSIAAQSPPVKYSLKVGSGSTNSIDVGLTFNLGQGKKAILKPSSGSLLSGLSPGATTLELTSQPEPGYSVEPLPAPDVGWIVSATASKTMTIGYRVIFLTGNATVSAGDVPGVGATGPHIFVDDLKAFRGSDLLICPRYEDDNVLLSNSSEVRVKMAEGETALAPWDRSGESFVVNGTSDLLDNYLVWGRMVLTNANSGGSEIAVGFSGEYAKLSSEERKQYTNQLSSLVGNLASTLGPRPDMDRLAILVCGAGQFSSGIQMPSSLKDSIILFEDGKKLAGDSAVAACRGIFQLWNAWKLVPRKGDEAAWLQEGSPLYYGYLGTTGTGLMSADSAYSGLAGVYISYLGNPLATGTTLAEAEKSNPPADDLLVTKGAVVCASLDQKLRSETGGSKNFEWFLGQLSEKFNHFEGRDYDLNDIEARLEDVTGKSWNSFFVHELEEKTPLLFSEFSETELFGKQTKASTSTGQKVESKGSSSGWLFIVVAVIVILMIPLIFSAYIRRSVKLDISMPRILPDDDDEEEESKTPPESSLEDGAGSVNEEDAPNQDGDGVKES